MLMRFNTTLSNNARAEMAQSTSSSATRERNVNLDKKIIECSHNLSSGFTQVREKSVRKITYQGQGTVSELCT